jgi:hypothetical protein
MNELLINISLENLFLTRRFQIKQHFTLWQNENDEEANKKVFCHSNAFTVRGVFRKFNELFI